MPAVAASDWEKALRDIRGAFPSGLDAAGDLSSLESLRVALLGRKGSLTELLKQLKDLSLDDRKRLGPEGNRLKNELETRLDEKKASLENAAAQAELLSTREDLSLPGRPFPRGRRHPLSLTLDKMTSILSRLGFSWADGPLVESDYYNFEALNFAPEHPARDLQDTFFLESEPGAEPMLMRTHTSPVQIRAMKSRTPPIRVMAPGRVFRHEALDATHSHVFHQVEGLYVDRKVSMADLKGTLSVFMKELFGSSTEVRFRPSYFPFVEPGAEVDVTCLICGGKNPACAVCKGTGYLEMLGAGLVHPNVLLACGHDPRRYKGFAFGVGVERVAMMLFGVKDLRQFYENDLRFLEQFG